MKKTLALLLASVMLLAALSACGKTTGGQEDVQPAEQTTTTTTAPAEETETTDPEPEPGPAHAVPTDITADRINGEDGSTAKLVITAKADDGTVLWTYTTPDCIQTELDTVEYIGENGKYVYVNEQAIAPDAQERRLRALDIYTGEVIWDNTDYTGAGSHSLIDASTGILYIGGYYGPDLMAIDYNGNTMWTVSHPDWYWCYDVRFAEGDQPGLILTYEGTDTGEDGEIFVTLDGVVAKG